MACQALVSAAGVTLGQFRHFMQQAEEQISMLIMEARANDLLFMGEDDDNDAHAPSAPVIHELACSPGLFRTDAMKHLFRLGVPS